MSASTPPTGPTPPEQPASPSTPQGGATDPYAASGEPPAAPWAPQPPAPPYAAPGPYTTPGVDPATPPPGYGTPYAAPQQPRTDGVSIAALVTGILGMALIPLGLGIAGVVRTKDPARSGRGLAIAGIVLGALGTVGWAILVGAVLFVANNQDFQDAFTEGFEESYQEGLQEGMGLGYDQGDCFDLPYEATTLEEISPADCDTPHTSEVVGVHTLEGDTFPGTDAIETSFEDLCSRSFTVYVGIGYEDSSLSMYYIGPDETTWGFGDRQMLCVVENPDGTPLEDSVAASRR